MASYFNWLVLLVARLYVTFVEDVGKIGFVVCWSRNFMVSHSALFEIVRVSLNVYAMPIGSVGRRVVILS